MRRLIRVFNVDYVRYVGQFAHLSGEVEAVEVSKFKPEQLLQLER